MQQSKKRPTSPARSLRPVAGGRTERETTAAAPEPRRALSKYERDLLSDLLSRAKAEGFTVHNF